ncbi:MAG: sugar phosphate isomerase/epimerase [Gemmatimonadaceae bacterium]
MLDRRQFLLSAAAATTAVAVGCARTRPGGTTATRVDAPASSRLPLGFSTLGCPAWGWRQVLDFAAAHGYAAIELRGLAGTMDLTERPEFAASRIADARRDLREHGLQVVCLGSSATMHEMDPAIRVATLAHARSFIDLAHALGTPYVRVFGNKYVAGVAREVMLNHIAAGLRELGDYATPRDVTVLLESHGDFTDSATLLDIVQRANSTGVALLWDAHHTFVASQEEPEHTVRQLAPYIRHTHLKDSVAAGKDRRYVLTGTGSVPVQRQINALSGAGYRGYYSFEWEKRWHPEIEEPEVAFAQYARVAGEYLRGAHVRSVSPP